MMNTKVTIMLVLSLSLVAPGAFTDVPILQSVTGTVQIVGTRVKTEGVKSDKEVVVNLEKVDEQVSPLPPTETAVLDIFIPHVMDVHKGATVEFLNSDTKGFLLCLVVGSWFATIFLTFFLAIRYAVPLVLAEKRRNSNDH